MDKKTIGNKESDRLTAAGTSAILKANKLRTAIAVELNKEGVKEELMDYIFGGDPKAVSPLAEIRKEYK